MRVLIFIGLKLAEIAGLCVAVCGLYFLGLWNPAGVDMIEPNYFDFFMCGLCYIVFCFVSVMVFMGICSVVKANWRKAGKLANRRK